MNASKIDLDDLIMALSSRYELDDPSHYLDTQTGEVIYAGEGLEALPADLKDNPRYRWIEPVQPDIALGIMEDFIAQLDEPDAAAQLRTAFEDNEPFEAFKEALAALPQLRDRWFLFHHQAYAALARAWIEQQQ
ncbi:MAG: UPF0158 family protein [Pseudomonadota bacterium]